MINRINKWLPLIGWTTIISIICGGIYWFGGFVTDVKKGVLTPKERVDVLEVTYTMPTPLQNYKTKLEMEAVQRKNAKNAEHAMFSRAMRDTAVINALDLGQRNAVQIYQIKEQQDTIIKLLKQK